LAGVPFGGKTGWKSATQHLTEDKHMFLLYAPHLGISKDGEIGMKDGKRDFSFTMDAYDAILKEQKSPSKAKSEQVPEENH